MRPVNETARTRPFAAFEWLLSGRYLRARRKEGFISVIAGFSFLGIMLGVATLIIVMAVMNGFRKELLDKILGLTGHLLVQTAGIAADRLEGRRRGASASSTASVLPRRSWTVRRWRLPPSTPPGCWWRAACGRRT